LHADRVKRRSGKRITQPGCGTRVVASKITAAPAELHSHN
jgi:hypothetical protein